MIRLENFSVINLFNDARFILEDNKFTFLMGRNGSGKSQLLKYIYGLYDNYKGTITNDNIVVDENNYKELQSEILFLDVNFSMQFVGINVEDEIYFVLEQNGLSYTTEIEELKNDFDFKSNLVSLNKVDKIKLLVTCGMLINKKYYIFDEVLTNLNLIEKRELYNFLKNNNLTCLFVTNVFEETIYADVCYKIHDLRLELITKFDEEISTKFNDTDTYEVMKINDIYFNKGLNIFESLTNYNKLLSKKCNIESKLNKINIISNEISIHQLRVKCFDMLDMVDTSYREMNELINIFGFKKKYLDYEVSQISTGNLVILLIIQALLNKCEVLIIDEIFEFINYSKFKVIFNYLLKNVECVVVITKNISLFNEYHYKLNEGVHCIN